MIVVGGWQTRELNDASSPLADRRPASGHPRLPRLVPRYAQPRFDTPPEAASAFTFSGSS
jgi:hypothetical protein